MTNEIFKDLWGNIYDYEIYDNKEGRGYHITKNGRKEWHQYDQFLFYPEKTLEENAILHIRKIIKREAEVERERISIEDLQKQIDHLKTENEELKKINAEQDTMLAELAML